MACTKAIVFQQKLLEKSIFHGKNDWSGYGPAGQFSALTSPLIYRLMYGNPDSGI